MASLINRAPPDQVIWYEELKRLVAATSTAETVIMAAVASESVVIAIETLDGRIEADVAVPNLATGLVIFAHGSGSVSSRNRAIANALQERRLGRVLLDSAKSSNARTATDTRRHFRAAGVNRIR